jgi:hypothetical protein
MIGSPNGAKSLRVGAGSPTTSSGTIIINPAYLAILQKHFIKDAKIEIDEQEEQGNIFCSVP